MLILVTGGAGYIGSHTILELLSAGYDVIAIDDLVNAVEGFGAKPTALERVEKLAGRDIIFYNVSTRDRKGLTEVFQKHNISVVIHFAALKAVGESVGQPLRYYSNNVTGTITLLEVMQQHSVRHLVFSSSATVYGSPQYLPIDERHPIGQNITNPYGQTKYMCEQMLNDLAHADKSWKIVVLRYFNPVGAHPSGSIGEDPKGIPNNLVPFVSQVAVGSREKVQIFGSDYDTADGTGVRDYIHVVDLSKGHVAALEFLKKKEGTEDTNCGWRAFNLGTGNGVSVLEMIEAFSRACGHSIAYELVGRRVGDCATVVATCELAKSELGWEATRTLEDMCNDTWRWQKKNPTGYTLT